MQPDSSGIAQLPDLDEGLALIPQRCSQACLLAPRHPPAGLRALVDADDRLVLRCAVCERPLLLLGDWDPQVPAEILELAGRGQP